MQLDASGASDGQTVVIKGTATTQLTDTFTIAPPSQPQGTVTYVITPSDGLLTLSSSDAKHRFSLGAVVGGIQTYKVVFDGSDPTDWTTPVLITVTAVNDYNRTDPHYTTLTITTDTTVAGPRHGVRQRLAELRRPDPRRQHARRLRRAERRLDARQRRHERGRPTPTPCGCSRRPRPARR